MEHNFDAAPVCEDRVGSGEVVHGVQPTFVPVKAYRKTYLIMGGSPGLVVMGLVVIGTHVPKIVNSNPGTGWTFFHLPICCKICNVCLKRRK